MVVGFRMGFGWVFAAGWHCVGAARQLSLQIIVSQQYFCTSLYKYQFIHTKMVTGENIKDIGEIFQL